MALKKVLNSLKKDGYIVKKLDYYLMTKNDSNDRAINVNSPSAVGTCLRARYYTRTGTGTSESFEARTLRIFDNGTGVHERLQKYLVDMGMLLLDEVPVHDYDYNIQGHTDGLIRLTPSELGVLEIKSMNDRNFANLKDAEEKHKSQALVYLYCLEQRRQHLRDNYEELVYKEMREEYEARYQHMTDGSIHSREDKIEYQCSLCWKRDNLLFECTKPLNKCILLYENKNNQELKEFTVLATKEDHLDLITTALEDFDTINQAVESGEIPPRGGRVKSDPYCRWCPYRTSECWVL